MPDLRRANCQSCGGHRDDVGSISWRGLCESCGVTNASANVVAMVERRGPTYERWVRRSYLAAQRARVALEREAV